MNLFSLYLNQQHLAPSTQITYKRLVQQFLNWRLEATQDYSEHELLDYLAYLKQQGQEGITRRNSCIALNHFFKALIEADILAHNPLAFIKLRGLKKQKLYTLFDREGLQALHEDFHIYYVQQFNEQHLPKNQIPSSRLSKARNSLILSFLVYQGLTTRDIEGLELNDIEDLKARVYIKARPRSHARYIKLEAVQMALLVTYLQETRPCFVSALNTASTQCFLPLPEQTLSTKQLTTTSPRLHYDLSGVMKNLSKQLKVSAPSFQNSKQLRASVITLWIQTVGLRQAQYLAGHKYISSTERYKLNDIKRLQEDINAFNPF